jgi:hypothetical protein
MRLHLRHIHFAPLPFAVRLEARHSVPYLVYSRWFKKILHIESPALLFWPANTSGTVVSTRKRPQGAIAPGLVFASVLRLCWRRSISSAIAFAGDSVLAFERDEQL